jgi:hypothetical protein
VSEPSRWEQLAGRARIETPPRVDVTQRVMAEIARRSGQPATRLQPRALLWCALGSLAAAGIVAAVAASGWSELGDPLVDLLQAADMVLR